MIIGDNRVVSLHYKLTGTQGQLLDSSENQAPLVYMHNTGSLLPGLEKALTGARQGELLQVSIKAEDAYGAHFDELVQDMPLAAFEGQPLSPGMQFSAQGENGQTQLVTVIQVHQNVVTVDANHPLAGENLTFDVAIMDVREPSATELQHGHVHVEHEAVDNSRIDSDFRSDADGHRDDYDTSNEFDTGSKED